MKRGIVAVVAGIFLAAGSGADELGAAMRGIVEKHGSAVVHVKLVIKQTYTIPEYGTESEEYAEEIIATTISPEGLMVTSLLSTDPAAWMDSFFGEEEGFSSKTELTSLKVLQGESEVDAEIVLRDQDLDLAFLRPVKKPEVPLPHVDLAPDVKAEVFDEVISVYRMGKVAQRVPTAGTQRIGAVQERPRHTYILGEYSGSGTPVFLKSGACLGINVTRKLGGGGQNGPAIGLSDDFDLNMASIVIPGPEILEIAKQVPAYSE